MKLYISLTGRLPWRLFFKAMAIRQLYEYTGLGNTFSWSSIKSMGDTALLDIDTVTGFDTLLGECTDTEFPCKDDNWLLFFSLNCEFRLTTFSIFSLRSDPYTEPCRLTAVEFGFVCVLTCENAVFFGELWWVGRTAMGITDCGLTIRFGLLLSISKEESIIFWTLATSFHWIFCIQSSMDGPVLSKSKALLAWLLFSLFRKSAFARIFSISLWISWESIDTVSRKSMSDGLQYAMLNIVLWRRLHSTTKNYKWCHL